MSAQFAFAEETDALDQEEPSYPIASFVADTGGAAGLIFGLNIMGKLIKNYLEHMLTLRCRKLRIR